MSRQSGKKPLLSIGIIFKDNIACLERCLKSLEPLRSAIPCEVVMADTGSTDGSREIAEKYADVVFDFPWVNDFAAARNAVLDRCSGAWHLAVDSDEWLDESYVKLVNYLRSPDVREDQRVLVIQRNFMSLANMGDYEDSLVPRLGRLEHGLRYEGAIHEYPVTARPDKRPHAIRLRLLHDGYATEQAAGLSARRERNMALLRSELEEKPEDLRVLTECVQSEPDPKLCLDYARRLAAAIQAERPGFRQWGPTGFETAIQAAFNAKETELMEQWTRAGLAQFPHSLILQVNANGYAAMRLCVTNRHREALAYGRAWEAGLERMDRGDGLNELEMVTGSLRLGNESSRFHIRVLLADSACALEDWAEGRRLLRAAAELPAAPAVLPMLFDLLLLHAEHLPFSEPLGRYWAQLLRDAESENAYLRAEAQKFRGEILRVLNARLQPEEPSRAAALQLLADMGNCDPGRGARVLLAEDPAAICAELERVENWDDLPAPALAHAVARGAALPDAFFRLPCERMAAAAASAGANAAAVLAYAAADGKNELMHQLWLDDLAAVALQNAAWEGPEQGCALCALFLRLERALLTRLYSPGLGEAELPAAPAAHRFGWRLLRASEALGRGGTKEGLRLLRDAAEDVPAMKDAALFLLDHMDVLRPVPPPSPELLALAEQVRAILSQYTPDDPAVLELKNSPIYQKVAHLIEQPEGGAHNG